MGSYNKQTQVLCSNHKLWKEEFAQNTGHKAMRTMHCELLQAASNDACQTVQVMLTHLASIGRCVELVSRMETCVTMSAYLLLLLQQRLN
jgi:hypothetical protein